MKAIDYSIIPYDDNERNAFNFRQRRHTEWTDNYELFRNKVIINRLTQRQAVNIPLMKKTIKTIMANTDEFPAIEFEELGNDKQAEIFFNELWKQTVIDDKMEIKDVVDKKLDFLYGRTWKKLNIRNGKFESENKEPFDMLVDRYVDPTDLETAKYVIESGVYIYLDELASNPLVDPKVIEKLKTYYATQQGLIRATQVTQDFVDKNKRLGDMGVPDIENPALGQTVIELKIHYIKVWDIKDNQDHIHVVLRSVGGLPTESYGDGKETVMAKPLMEILGVDFYPFVTWADDPEKNDFYSDGVADIVRVPNQVLNVWFSQLVENRSLRNFNMFFFDSTAGGGDWAGPQGWTPEPWGFYPLPGNPKDMMMPANIPDLGESLEEMTFVQDMVGSATAATNVKQGETEKGTVTLGEVQLATAAANERITSISKFYMLAMKEFGDKWAKLMIANADKLDVVKLYKKSHKGNYFSKTVKPKDWKSDDGYTCQVVSSAEREQNNLQDIQKLSAVAAQFQGNPAMTKIYHQHLLDFINLTPEEEKQVMDADEQMQKALMAPQPGQPGQPPNSLDQALQQQSSQLTEMQNA